MNSYNYLTEAILSTDGLNRSTSNVGKLFFDDLILDDGVK